MRSFIFRVNEWNFFARKLWSHSKGRRIVSFSLWFFLPNSNFSIYFVIIIVLHLPDLLTESTFLISQVYSFFHRRLTSPRFTFSYPTLSLGLGQHLTHVIDFCHTGSIPQLLYRNYASVLVWRSCFWRCYQIVPPASEIGQAS